MAKYILGRKNGIFNIHLLNNKTDMDKIESSNDVLLEVEETRTCTDRHFKDYQSKGICVFDFGMHITFGNFTINRLMQGSWTCFNDYSNSKSTYGCHVKDTTGEETVVIIEGYHITDEIVKFFNILSQFESLKEYLSVNVLDYNSHWASLELADKICELAEVVKIYKKYKEINPATAIVRDMESLIEKRLKSIIKSEKAD